jgi:hypothetical protein
MITSKKKYPCVVTENTIYCIASFLKIIELATLSSHSFSASPVQYYPWSLLATGHAASCPPHPMMPPSTSAPSPPPYRSTSTGISSINGVPNLAPGPAGGRRPLLSSARERQLSLSARVRPPLFACLHLLTRMERRSHLLGDLGICSLVFGQI